jgi:hypothetical protein
MLAFTQYELYEPAATEQANFDMLFPTIVRPISSSAIAETRPGRLSGSVSSLIAGVSQIESIYLGYYYFIFVFEIRISHLKLALFDNYHLVHHFNEQVLLFEY